MKTKITHETLYRIGYSLIVLSDMFANVKYLESMTDYIVIIGVAILLFHIIYCGRKYKVATMLFWGLLGILFLCSYSIYRDFTLLRFIVLLIASLGLDFDRIVKFDLKIKMIFLLTVMLLSALGMCLITEFVRGNQIRYTLGFFHPNTAGFYIMIIVMEYIYLHRGDLKWRCFLILIFAGAFIWTVTGSRGSVAAIVIVCVGLFLQKIRSRHYNLNKLGKSMIQYIFPIVTFLVLLLIWAYDRQLPWALKLNAIFSFRLQYFTYYYKLYPLNMLGNRVSFNKGALDNAYLALLIHYGVLAYGLYCILYCRKMKELYEKKDFAYFVILVAIAMYGVMETTIIKAAYNVFLVSFTSVLFQKNKTIRQLEGKRKYNA